MSGIILLVNGPNLNMLGVREPEKYGKTTLEEIVEKTAKRASESGFRLKAFQSNHEGSIIDFIQKEGMEADGMLLNAGAFTHTSVAVRDAILSVKLPFIELHLSNVFAREEFRHRSFLSDIAAGVICGFGETSYELAIRAMIDFLSKRG
jgi:3-dehydroquinate dehydratase-2